jgi:integrase
MHVKFSTEAEVQHLPAPAAGRPAIHYLHDTEPGFGVRVNPPRRDGKVSRTWFVRLGERRQLMGEVGRISIKDAKFNAIALRAQHKSDVHHGINAYATLGQAYAHYESKRGGDWSDDTRRGYARDVGHLADLWHVPLKKLTPNRISDCLDGVRERAKATNARRGSKGDGRPAATSVARLLNAILNHACRYRFISQNPMVPLVAEGAIAPTRRSSRAVTHQSVAPFWSWLHTQVHPAARDWILINLFLCLRRSVIGQLRWSQLDTKNWVLVVPAETRGNKRKELFALPIPKYLVEKVFRPRLQDPNRHPEWIIESNKRRGQPLKNVRTILETAEAKLGIKLSMHDLRRTGATWMRAATRDTLLVRRVLTHKLDAADDIDATTAGYIADTTETLRVGMDRTVDFVLAVAKEGWNGAPAADSPVPEFAVDEESA